MHHRYRREVLSTDPHPLHRLLLLLILLLLLLILLLHLRLFQHYHHELTNSSQVQKFFCFCRLFSFVLLCSLLYSFLFFLFASFLLLRSLLDSLFCVVTYLLSSPSCLCCFTRCTCSYCVSSINTTRSRNCSISSACLSSNATKYFAKIRW